MNGGLTATFPEEVLAAPAVERSIALDLGKKAAIVAPVVALVVGLFRGLDGAAAVVLAFALVAGLFFVSAALISWSVRLGPSAVMMAVLGGFLVRLVALFALGLGIEALGWPDLPVFALTLIAGYLVLLFWELRSISLSLAFPGLKPRSKETE